MKRMKTLLLAVCSSTALALSLPTASQAQNEYPCNQWVDRVVNENAPDGGGAHTGVIYGYEKIIYRNGTRDNNTFAYTSRQVTNIYGSSYQNYGDLNTSAPAMKAGTEIKAVNEKLFYMGEDNRFYVFAWNGTMWAATAYNSLAPASTDFYFDVDANEHIFYAGSSGDLYRLFGPNNGDWDNMGGYVGGDVTVDGNELFVVSTNDYIAYFKKSGANWASMGTLNLNAPKAEGQSEILSDNGNIYYYGTDNKLRFIGGSNYSVYGLLNSSAPKVSNLGTPLCFDNDKIVYIDENEKFRMMLKVGGNWYTSLIHSTAARAYYTGMDFIDGRGIVYSALDQKIHELTYNSCPMEGPGFKHGEQSEESLSHAGELLIYPSPAHNFVTIEAPAEFQDGYIEVRDMSGRLVHAEAIYQGSKFQVNLSHESPGLYVIHFSSSLGSQSYKLIKD